jgi:aryl-alcohol dehydrogenase-like predicted oxidoreductase
MGCTPAHVALAWQRTRPVTSVILGARTLTQLDDNLASLAVTIPAELLAELERATAVPDEYPGAFIDTCQAWLRGEPGALKVSK